MSYVYGGRFNATAITTNNDIITSYSAVITPIDVDRQCPICIVKSSRKNTDGIVLKTYSLIRAYIDNTTNQIKYKTLNIVPEGKSFPTQLQIDGQEHSLILSNPDYTTINTCPLFGNAGISIASSSPYNKIQDVNVTSSDIPIFELPEGTTPPSEFDECTAAHDLINDYLTTGNYDGASNKESIDGWHVEFVVYMSGNAPDQLFTIITTENDIAKSMNNKYAWSVTPSIAEPTIDYSSFQSNSRITFTSGSVSMGLDEFTLLIIEQNSKEDVAVEFNIKNDNYSYIKDSDKHISITVIKGDPPPSKYDPPKDSDNGNPNINFEPTNEIVTLRTTYQCDDSSLEELGSFIWSTNFFDNILKNWTSPIENIVSIRAMPVSFPAGDISNIIIGNVKTSIQAMKVQSSTEIIVGTCPIPYYYYNFLDCESFTSLILYLPLYGFADLNVSTFIGRTLKVTCVFDVVKGSVLYKVFANDIQVEQYACEGSISISISQLNDYEVRRGMMNGLLGTALNMIGDKIFAGLNRRSISSTSVDNGTLMSHSSRMSYVIITRPTTNIPSTFGHDVGFLWNSSAKIKSLKGYTICKNPDMSGVGLTDEEKEELYQIMTSGFYV